MDLRISPQGGLRLVAYCRQIPESGGFANIGVALEGLLP
jgi:hypothetical protein